MKIVLKNFGCYSKKVFVLDNNYILLNGTNGSGKSTVFHAICYALYGKCKILKYGESSMSVEIINSDCRILRVSKPIRLIYESLGVMYEGDKAQAMIENYYHMNWEQFNICAWINSTTKASIATITPMERYNVIRTMVCNSEESIADVEAITDCANKLDNKYNELLQERTMYKKMKNDYEDFEKPPVVKIRDDIDGIICKLEKQLDEIYTSNRGMNREDIEKRIADIKTRPQLVQKLQYYKTLLNYEHKKNKRLNAEREYGELVTKYFRDIEKSLNDNITRLSEINEEVLKSKMQEYSIRMIAKDKKNPYWNYHPVDIADLLKNSANEVVTSQMRSTAQKCPHCDKMICINEDVVLVYHKKYANTKNYISRSHQLFLEELSELIYPYSNVENEYNEFTTLKNSIKEAEKILDGKILNSELVKMNKNIGSTIKKPSKYIEIPIPKLEELIEQLYIEIGGIDEESSGELDNLQRLLISDRKLPDILSIKSELSKMRELQNIRNAQLQYNKIKDKLVNINNKLEACNNEIDEVLTTKNSINILKIRQKEAEILSMQNILNTINTYSKKYLDMFFDKPINIHISMIRKTAKTTKMSLEINCEYNGYKYTDINNFSQGELIKINLAFIFALNQLTNCKFLLLDEVMSNIDKEIIGDIYEVIREISSDRQIIVIDHNATIGSFENIIEF